MPSITLKSDDIKRLQGFFETNPNLAKKYTTIAMRKSMLLLERQSKIEAPVLTGRLRSSIRSSIGTLQSTLSVNVNYALPVHEGARGRRPNPFLYRAINTAENRIEVFFTQALQGIINEIKNA